MGIDIKPQAPVDSRFNRKGSRAHTAAKLVGTGHTLERSIGKLSGFLAYVGEGKLPPQSPAGGHFSGEEHTFPDHVRRYIGGHGFNGYLSLRNRDMHFREFHEHRSRCTPAVQVLFRYAKKGL